MMGDFCWVLQKEDDSPHKRKKTECVVKTHDRSETFVLQGNIVIIHQSLLNSIFTTKLYILMKKINYKQR
jgi:ABC-type Fe3+/spermidine/putrescine transport system ATPase subunit